MTDGQLWLDRARREPDPARADQLAARAVNARPEAPEAYVLRGQIAVHRGDGLAAAHHLRIAFARGARDTFTRDVLGLCLAAAGQPELAARMRVSATTPPALQALEAGLRAQADAVRAVLARALPAPQVPGWLPGESAPAESASAESAPGESAPGGSAPGESAPGESGTKVRPVQPSEPETSGGATRSAVGPPGPSGSPASPEAAAPRPPAAEVPSRPGTAEVGAGTASAPRSEPPPAAIRKLSLAPTPRASHTPPAGAPTPPSRPPGLGEPIASLASFEVPAHRGAAPAEGQVSVVRSALAGSAPASTALASTADAPVEGRDAAPAPPANLSAFPSDSGGGVRVVRGPAPLGQDAAEAPGPPAPLPPSVAPLELPRSAPPAPRPEPAGVTDGGSRPVHLPTASTAPAPSRPLRIHRIATVQPDWLDSTPQYHAEAVPVAADWLEGTQVPGQPRTDASAFTGGGIELSLDPGEVTVAVRSPVTGRLVQADEVRRQRQGASMPALDVSVGRLDARDAFTGQMNLDDLLLAVDLPGPVLTRPKHPPRQLAKAVAAGLTSTELLLRDRHDATVALQRLGLGTFERIEVLSDGGQLSCVWADGRALHLDLRALRASAPVVASAFVRTLLACAQTASGG